jgi:hypothetical protein
MAASTTPRYGTTSNKDNTGRVTTYSYLTPTYAATMAVAPKTFRETNKIALTGALTVNATTTDAFADDEIVFLFSSDASIRIVTFGTNFISAGTLTVAASKNGSATFKFNGTSYIEKSRFVQP